MQDSEMHRKIQKGGNVDLEKAHASLLENSRHHMLAFPFILAGPISVPSLKVKFEARLAFKRVECFLWRVCETLRLGGILQWLEAAYES